MAVKIRLARHGSKKRPYYRVVVADGRCPRDGRWIEEVGCYNPCTSPAHIKLDLSKIDEWIKKGAQLTNRVAYLIEQKGGKTTSKSVNKANKESVDKKETKA